MSDKNENLALVLGAGGLVESLILELIKRRKSFIIIAIKNFYEFEKKYKANYTLTYGNLGNIFSILKKNNINKIMFLGNIKKLKLLSIKPNLITFYYICKIILHYNKGDSSLLHRIMELFMKKKICVIDSREYLNKNLAKRKVINFNFFKSNLSKDKVLKYFNLCKKFGELDEGQCIIINKDRIVLKEDREGTNLLIEKFKKYKFKGNSYLVKTSKPSQDLKIDLPTIGPETINNMKKSGLKGIIIEAGKTYIYKPYATYHLIKKYKILFYAI